MAIKSLPMEESERMKLRAMEILNVQKDAVKGLKVTDSMLDAIEVIKQGKEKGRIITAGMGKAGIIAQKMSATLSSIGIPSFFVNPAEAAHGDIGRIAPEDIVVIFSNSGSTLEVLKMIRTLHGLNEKTNKVISIGSSTDPKVPVDIAVGYGKLEESCVVEKVPSTSTTIMLIIADIIAISAAESLGFETSWFKKRHPGGAIGDAYSKEN